MSALGAWAGVGSTLCPPAVNGGPGEIGTISTTHTPATLNWSTTGWLGVFNAALVDQVDPGCNGARPWLACRVASQSPVTASLGRCIARDSLSHLHNTCHTQIFLLDDQLLTFYIPAPPPCLRFSSLACSTEALHSLTSPTLTDSLQPLISTPHYQHLS